MTTNRNSVIVLTISNIIKTGYIQDGARMADIRKFITKNVLYMLLIVFVVTPCILILMFYVHQQMHLFISLREL
jgi:hypothetical protein